MLEVKLCKYRLIYKIISHVLVKKCVTVPQKNFYMFYNIFSKQRIMSRVQVFGHGAALFKRRTRQSVVSDGG